MESFVSERAPAPIGPYSQAVRAGAFLFCSGQIPIDPATGELVPGDVAAQTRQVMKNLEAVLEAAGLRFANVVKTTIFLVDMADFGAVNGVYGEAFGTFRRRGRRSRSPRCRVTHASKSI